MDDQAANDDIDALADVFEGITVDTSRRAINRMTDGLIVCSVCEFAFETFGKLRQHVRNVHAEDLDGLRQSIADLESIQIEDLTQAQKHNLIVLRRRRGFLRRLSSR